MAHDAEITGYLFKHARDVILVICARTGNIIDANPAAEEAYRYTRAELLARSIYDLRSKPGPAISELAPVAMSTGLLIETLHKRSDGTTFPVEVSARGETLSAGPALFCIIRDITERKRFETEREELLLATQRALAVRDEFLVIASHELRAPVTNISLQLQQLSRLIDRGTVRAALKVVGEAVHGEALRLASLIDALLDAQAVKGKLVLDREDIELSALVTAVVERMCARAEQAGSELIVDVPQIHGRWDRMRIDQVVSNLLTNAIKYGRGRPVRVLGGIEGGYAHIEICDEGIGVSQEDVDRIFGKFERAVPSQYGGLGLGLFIARQIVDAHDGMIRVHSVPGVGSTFRVLLPRA
jgi:PAS domain S-box-containing protein